MKIIVTLSALVLIVSLWGCSSKPAGSEANMTGECAGMVGLVTSGNRNVSSMTNCSEAAKTVAPTATN